MPKGPKGKKHPADVIGNAVKVMRIATGEESETLDDDGKNAGAVALAEGRAPRALVLHRREAKECRRYEKAGCGRWRPIDLDRDRSRYETHHFAFRRRSRRRMRSVILKADEIEGKPRQTTRQHVPRGAR